MKPYLFLFLVSLLLIVGPTPAQLPPSGFEVGQAFPAIMFPALEDGRPTSITQFRGEKLILHIFASW